MSSLQPNPTPILDKVATEGGDHSHHGVMRGLDRVAAEGGGTYFDKIVFISGVSGGSIAAAYYGLRGRAALVDFRERFLVKNAEEDLDTELSLVNLSRGFGGGGINEARTGTSVAAQARTHDAVLCFLVTPG